MKDNWYFQAISRCLNPTTLIPMKYVVKIPLNEITDDEFMDIVRLLDSKALSYSFRRLGPKTLSLTFTY